jgi:hypothetical protein
MKVSTASALKACSMMSIVSTACKSTRIPINKALNVGSLVLNFSSFSAIAAIFEPRVSGY